MDQEHQFLTAGTENNVCSHPVFLFPGKPGRSDKEADIDTDIEVAQSCLTLRPHGLQPTRLLRPWNFPGKRTGVGAIAFSGRQSEISPLSPFAPPSLPSSFLLFASYFNEQSVSKEQISDYERGGSFTHGFQFCRSVVSDSLQPHESQHARPPCPSQTPGVYSNSCPLSQ